jgi:hypothetical protein
VSLWAVFFAQQPVAYTGHSPFWCHAPLPAACPGHVCRFCLLVLVGLKLYLGRCSHLLAACRLAFGPRAAAAALMMLQCADTVAVAWAHP